MGSLTQTSAFLTSKPRFFLMRTAALLSESMGLGVHPAAQAGQGFCPAARRVWYTLSEKSLLCPSRVDEKPAMDNTFSREWASSRKPPGLSLPGT